MKELQESVRQMERELEQLLRMVVADRGDFYYGFPLGGYDREREVVQNVSGKQYVSLLLTLYDAPESKYYRDGALVTRAEDYFGAMLRQQSPEGFISLIDCNISSPPDTAFHVNWYAMFLRYLESRGGEWGGTRDCMRQFIRRAAEGLCTGGFHTPNHRWVIACALCFSYALFGDERFRSRAETLLTEGLDVNAYGEWTEKSNSIYNAVCDLFLYHVGEVLGDDAIFEAVRRNLNMMKVLFHPGGLIATEYSTRQDKGQKVRMGADYAVVYRLMAAKDGDRQYAYLARQAAEDCGYDAYLRVYEAVYGFSELPAEAPSRHYTVLLNEGEAARGGFGKAILRHRDGDFSLTAMEDEKAMLYVQYGGARIFGVSLVAGWFGVAAVPFATLRRGGENKYVLETALDGSYMDVLPRVETADLGGNWARMDNAKRARVNALRLKVAATLTVGDGYVDLTVNATDVPRILLQLVCKVDSECAVTGGAGLIWADAHNGLLTDGDAVCESGGARLTISGGEFGHGLIHLRNYVTDTNAKNVLVNFVTPCKKTVRFRYGKEEGAQ
ncbi:hypothetical protein FACS189492_1460 [Clostridia bacterium]|nr:hypothetical protein FACS189492_1460 [Clostridia bacterium]